MFKSHSFFLQILWKCSPDGLSLQYRMTMVPFHQVEQGRILEYVTSTCCCCKPKFSSLLAAVTTYYLMENTGDESRDQLCDHNHAFYVTHTLQSLLESYFMIMAIINMPFHINQCRSTRSQHHSHTGDDMWPKPSAN